MTPAPGATVQQQPPPRGAPFPTAALWAPSVLPGTPPAPGRFARIQLNSL